MSLVNSRKRKVKETCLNMVLCQQIKQQKKEKVRNVTRFFSTSKQKGTNSTQKIIEEPLFLLIDAAEVRTCILQANQDLIVSNSSYETSNAQNKIWADKHQKEQPLLHRSGGGGADLGPFEPSYPTQARHLISKENINHFFTRFPRVIKSSAISRTFLLKNVMLTWFMNVHNNHFMFIIP